MQARSCATKPPVSLDSSCHGGCYPPLDASRQGSSAAFGNHCQGNAVPFGFPSQQGTPRPYWMTQSQRNCYPFGIPARFEMSTHKWKMVCGYSFQNAKIPRASSDKEKPGDFYTALIIRLRSFVCHAAQPPFICRRSIYSSLSSSPCEPQSRPADACRRDTRREPWCQPPDDRSCGTPTW